jgi:hypothetical protein
MKKRFSDLPIKIGTPELEKNTRLISELWFFHSGLGISDLTDVVLMNGMCCCVCIIAFLLSLMVYLYTHPHLSTTVSHLAQFELHF